MCNIEQWAVDLSWDIIARFSNTVINGTKDGLPREFFDDFVKVACDEAKVSSIHNYKLMLSHNSW